MSGSDLVPLYYSAGIAVAAGTGLWALRTWIKEQRDKWTREGKQQASLDQTLKDNTKAAADNTAAIGKLVEQLRDLGSAINEMRKVQNGHGEVLASLQQWRRDHAAQHDPD